MSEATVNEVTLNPPTGAAAVAPAGPVPQSPPHAGTIPAAPTIPDGDPAAAALFMLGAIAPDAAIVLDQRLTSIRLQLDELIEGARLDTRTALPEFITHVGRRVKLRQVLQARAGHPSGRSPAAEVLALVTSVRRWRPAEELRGSRAKIVGDIRTESVQIEGRIGALMATGAGPGLITDATGEHARTTGLVHPHDEWLRRAEALRTDWPRGTPRPAGQARCGWRRRAGPGGPGCDRPRRGR